MAGNTKLVGFSPRPDGIVGIGGVIVLERWGDKKSVGVSASSLSALRKACSLLPEQPPRGRDNDTDSFRVRYDESVGRIHLDLGTDAAHFLAQLIEGRLAEDPGELEVLNNRSEEKVRSWIHSLKASVQAHEDYHSVEGEPGVEDTD